MHILYIYVYIYIYIMLVTSKFESYSNQIQILMYEGNYQYTYQKFFDFSSIQEQILKFYHFLELLYHTFFESFAN